MNTTLDENHVVFENEMIPYTNKYVFLILAVAFYAQHIMPAWVDSKSNDHGQDHHVIGMPLYLSPWVICSDENGYEIQMNRFFGYCRIMDPNGYRVYLGTLSMCKSYFSLNIKPFLSDDYWSDIMIADSSCVQENPMLHVTRYIDQTKSINHIGSYESCKQQFISNTLNDNLNANEAHYVVILHGFFTLPAHFNLLKKQLVHEGYNVLVPHIAVSSDGLENHINRLRQVLESCKGINKISFVTHSFGCILLNNLIPMLTKDPHFNNIEFSHNVMIAPTIQGSQLIDCIQKWNLCDFVLGKSAVHMSTKAMQSYRWNFMSQPFGVIRGYTPLGSLNPFLNGKSDFIVRLDEAYHRDMNVVDVHGLHNTMLFDRSIIKHIVTYIKNGQF